MPDIEDKIYKSSALPTALREELKRDITENLEKFRDPVVLGELVYRLVEERENTNRLLKNILARLEAIERQGTHGKAEEILLPEIDEKIIELVKSLGKATAADIQERLSYKGKNAASARLNRLCGLGMLRKSQAGKRMYFLANI